MTQANPLFPVKEKFPELGTDINVDIAIAGGGIAGLSISYYLANAGYKVAVLEEQEVGGGATGASSGILYYGTGTDFTKAIELFGRETAVMLWEESRESIDCIRNSAEKNAIECDLRNSGAIVVAKDEGEKKFLEEEFRNLKSIGFEGKLIEASEIKNYFSAREFVAGLMQDSVIQISPAKYAAGLAKVSDVQVYNNSPLVGYKEEKESIVVYTPKAKVKTSKIIYTTNTKPHFGLESYFFLENSVILASEKLNQAQIKGIWPEHRIIWTLEEKYDIIYEHDSRAILELYSLKGVREKIKYYYPTFDFVKQYAWGDNWSKTNDWLPIIGKIKENIFASIAMGDQGIVMGVTAGRNAVDLVEGKSNDFLNLVSPKRFNR